MSKLMRSSNSFADSFTVNRRLPLTHAWEGSWGGGGGEKPKTEKIEGKGARTEGTKGKKKKKQVMLKRCF
jgi:hypothetical protein